MITEGSTAPDCAFQHVSRFHDELIQEIFTHEVFSLLLQKKLIGLPCHPPIIEDDPAYVPAKGWAETILKVYEVAPLICPSCGGRMEAERPPPPLVVQRASDGSRGEWGKGGVYLKT